jgi:hypothetical protein
VKLVGQWGVEGPGVSWGDVSPSPTCTICTSFLHLYPRNLGLAGTLSAGWDVWLSNSRGSTESRAHMWMEPDDPDFWSWSFDEMAQVNCQKRDIVVGGGANATARAVQQ